MDPSVIMAIKVYGIAAIISFLVALLIKGMFAAIKMAGRKEPSK